MSSTMTTLDCRGLSCPLPIAKTAQTMRTIEPGAVIEVLATDPGSVPDFNAWATTTGNTLVEHTEQDGVHRFVLRKKE